MSRGRFLSRSIATDKRLGALSLLSEFLFLKTIPHLDRDGLILAEFLGITVAPRRPEVASIDAELWREWVAVELVIAYETKEGTVLFFPGFTKNQQGMRYEREAPSRYEAPPDFIRTKTGLVPVAIPPDSGLTPEELRMNSGLTPPQGKVSKDKVRQEAPPIDDDFADAYRFWCDKTTRASGSDAVSLQAVFDEWKDRIDQEEIRAAILIAAQSKGMAATPAYLAGILRKRQSAAKSNNGTLRMYAEAER